MVRASFRMRSCARADSAMRRDRKSTRLNSSHGYISYAVFCLKKKKQSRRSRTSYLDSESEDSLSVVESLVVKDHDDQPVWLQNGDLQSAIESAGLIDATLVRS